MRPSVARVRWLVAPRVVVLCAAPVAPTSTDASDVRAATSRRVRARRPAASTAVRTSTSRTAPR